MEKEVVLRFDKDAFKEYSTLQDKIFWVELIGYWRLLYTLIGDDVQIIAFILEFMDHKEYNKLFGYKNR